MTSNRGKNLDRDSVMLFCHFELSHLPATRLQETMDREIILKSLFVEENPGTVAA